MSYLEESDKICERHVYPSPSGTSPNNVIVDDRAKSDWLSLWRGHGGGYKVEAAP